MLVVTPGLMPAMAAGCGMSTRGPYHGPRSPDCEFKMVNEHMQLVIYHDASNLAQNKSLSK